MKKIWSMTVSRWTFDDGGMSLLAGGEWRMGDECDLRTGGVWGGGKRTDQVETRARFAGLRGVDFSEEAYTSN